MLHQANQQDVLNTIQEFCRAFDLRDWLMLRRCLASNLATDYSDLRKTPPAHLTAGEFIALRQSGLSGLVTQHLGTNHLVTFVGERASCHFQFVIRRWPENSADTRYFHTFGHYHMILHRAPRGPHGWVIESITQRVLRDEGSPELHGARRCAQGQGCEP